MLGRLSILPWVVVLAVGTACMGESAPDPRVRLGLEDEELRTAVQQLRLLGYRDDPGLSCSGSAVVGRPAAPPELQLDVGIGSWRVDSFSLVAGTWTFVAHAGNEHFGIDSPKRLAEGCLQTAVEAGSAPTLYIEMRDLRPDYCGDDVLDHGEACDDGNRNPDDGCAPDCSWEPGRCGDGTLDRLETCDDGGTAAGDGCSADCHTEVFRVNQFTEDAQNAPRVAAGPSGFLVAWVDVGATGSTVDGFSAIVHRYFDSQGRPTANPVGGTSEYAVNFGRTGGTQVAPFAGWGDGGTVVTFIDQKFGTQPSDAMYQCYGTDRRPRFPGPDYERPLFSDFETNYEQSPAIASNPAFAGFVVASIAGQAAARRGRFRVFGIDGTPAAGHAAFPGGGAATEYLPAAAMTSIGACAVAWVRAAGDGVGTSIQMARFAPDGTPAAAESLTVNTTVAGDQTEPSIAFDGSGRSIVAWLDISSASVRVRRFDATGLPIDVADFPASVASITPGTAETARVATAVAGVGGVFLVVWTASVEGEVWGRLVSADAPGEADRFVSNRIDGTTGPFAIAGLGDDTPRAGRVAVASDGRALVVWQDGGDFGGADPGGGIRGRVLPLP
jgi:cysteine-rich repeat protein